MTMSPTDLQQALAQLELIVAEADKNLGALRAAEAELLANRPAVPGMTAAEIVARERAAVDKANRAAADHRERQAKIAAAIAATPTGSPS